MRDSASPNEFSDQAPNSALALTFVVLLLIQGYHQIDSALRVVQRFILYAPEANGLIGQYFDLEPLHLAYNIPILCFSLLVYRLSGAHKPDGWTRGMTAWWLLTIALILQGYHLIEHLFKIWQFIETGREGTPGILGNALDPIWLHFIINTLASLPVVAAFWLGGFHRGLGDDLRAAWSDLVGRPVDRPEAGRAMSLSRRTFLTGAAGIVAAIGASRIAVALRPPQISEIRLPTFVDVTMQSGITFRHRSHERLDVAQAGAAFLDFNSNGMPDIFLTNANGPNALYRNNGDGTFTDIAEMVGVADPDAMSVGVACADYDNDGNCDLLVTTMTGLKLFHNEGDGTFIDVSEHARLGGYQGHPTSAAWADFDGDGKLDLYVTYWLDQMPDDETLRLQSTASQLRRIYTPLTRTHRLFQNLGGGRFRDATGYLHPAGKHGAGLAAGFFDYDDDGRPDLYVVNDFGKFVQPNILYRNVGRVGDGGWLFTDVTEQAGVGAAFHGMGLAVGDYDGDGRLDMFVTNIGDNVLYRNRGTGSFVETNNRAGVTRGVVRGEDSVGWGTAFLDIDNNGLLDLYFVAGTLYPEPMDDGEYPPDQPNAMFRNRGDGTFEDVSSLTRTDHTGCGRGLAVADYDGDGFLDLLIANMDQRPALLRNPGNGNSWLQVQLAGTVSNRDGIGARLSLEAGGRTQIREIQSGTSFLSQNSLVAHFGLDKAGNVDRLTVKWPSGVVQELTQLPVNRKITVTEPERP